jgi:tetratricopeptide (TPR) repeat protein
MADPEWRLRAGRQLAYGEMLATNYDEAIATLNQLVESNTDDVELLLMRANAYAHSRIHFEEALADVDRIREIDPENVEAMEPRIIALLGLDRIEEAGVAIEDLGRRIEDSQLDTETQGWHCATAALFAEESGEKELAQSRWEDCTERFPDHSNVVGNAISFYDGQRDFRRSLEILRGAHEAKPESRQYRTRLAARLRASGQADEATEILAEATGSEKVAASATAWFDLAKHHQELDDPEATVEAFERSLEKVRETGVDLPSMRLEYADALLLAGRFDRALEVAEDMTVSAHRAVIRARVAQEQGDPEKALEYFDEAFRLWPDNPFARYYAARAAEAIGDFDRAIEAYRYSMRIAPGATDARVRLTRLLLAEGSAFEGIHMLRFQAEASPLDVEGELLTLHLWGRLGQGPSIRAYLDRIRKDSPAFLGEAVDHVAQGIREGSGPVAAIESIRREQGLRLDDPSHADSLRTLVRFSGEAKDLEAAARDVREALEAHPEAAVFHEINGLLLELGDDEAQAREAYQRALEIEPENVRALSGLGRTTLSQDPEAALALFERALAVDPFDLPAGRGATRALLGAGRHEAAVERLEATLQTHPYDGKLATRLAQLLLESGAEIDDERIRPLVRQAVRFGGGAQARALNERIETRPAGANQAETPADG